MTDILITKRNMLCRIKTLSQVNFASQHHSAWPFFAVFYLQAAVKALLTPVAAPVMLFIKRRRRFMQFPQKIRSFCFQPRAGTLFSPVLMVGTLCMIAPTPSPGAQSGESMGTDAQNQLCAKYIAHYQKTENIPSHLLTAISLVESGRWDSNKKQKFAWPWTVMAEGKGVFLPTKAEAVAKVKGLQKRGVSNIDVGCMQVNLTRSISCLSRHC